MTKTVLRIGRETYGKQPIEQIYHGALVVYFNEEDVQGISLSLYNKESELINISAE